MKKAIAFALLAGMGLGLVLVAAAPARAAVRADQCYENYDACRHNALTNNMGTLKTALALTMCDIALGRCIFLG